MENFRRQLSIKLGVTGIVTVILVGLIVYLASDIENKSNLIFLKRSDIASRLREIRDFSRLKESATVAEPLKNKLDKVLPKRDYLFTLPREFEKIASQEHLGFKFNFAEESKPNPNQPSQIKFLMTLQGKYKDVLNFLSDIENGPYFVNFTNLDMLRIGEDLNASFNVTINGEILFNE